MKNIILVVLFIAVICFCNTAIAQENEALTYLPLKVGNVWVYNCTAFGSAMPPCYCIRKYRFEINGTILRNSKLYYLIQMSVVSISSYCSGCYAPYLNDTIRIDSVTGNIYRYSSVNGCAFSPFEIMHDSLNAKINDTIRNNCGASQWKYKCTDTAYQSVFGINRKTKNFTEAQFEGGYGRAFAQGIGMIRTNFYAVFCNQNSSTLAGCVLDNVLYGDTSMLVGITQINSEVPDKFQLSQNYPNPYNPKTKITFQIPLSRGVDAEGGRGVFANLTVYDAIGREVEVLVNQQLQPGTYEVRWDATAYPSGVYYYRLEASNPSTSLRVTETKKMVLIK